MSFLSTKRRQLFYRNARLVAGNYMHASPVMAGLLAFSLGISAIVSRFTDTRFTFYRTFTRSSTRRRAGPSAIKKRRHRR